MNRQPQVPETPAGAKIALAMFYTQAIYGCIALFGLMIAAIWWRSPEAMGFALAGCVLVIATQSIAGLGHRVFALSLWLGAHAAGLLSFLALT